MIMVHRLYEHFLENPDEYRASENYWANLARDVARDLQVEEWRPWWIPRSYADGTPFEHDGNPIFDARSERLGRAFTVIQHAPTSNEIEIAAWLKHYPEEYVELPRYELVINLSLSEESAAKAEELLRKWMLPQTTVREMKELLDRLA
ncbi:MAG: hypothetical protein ACRDJG_04835 [Actinomycetota bacterium]